MRSRDKTAEIRRAPCLDRALDRLPVVPSAAVEVTNLTMTYRKGGAEFTAVDQLSISMNRGEITSILGPNGAGKTSTIEACEGFRIPKSGTIRVLGLDPQKDAAELRPRVGVMLQEGGAWLGVRAGELLDYIASLHAHPLPVPALLERLELQEHRQTSFRRLSGGQKQRLCLAMAIVGRPELVFLDEPTAGMDPHARRETWDLVRELRAGGAAVVLSTHHMDEAEALSDRVHILNHGSLAASGSPRELLQDAITQQLIVETSSDDSLDGILVSLPELHSMETVADGEFRFPVAASPELMASVARWCADHAVDLRAIRLAQPTLEERFLAITKRVSS